MNLRVTPTRWVKCLPLPVRAEGRSTDVGDWLLSREKNGIWNLESISACAREVGGEEVDFPLYLMRGLYINDPPSFQDC